MYGSSRDKAIRTKHQYLQYLHNFSSHNCDLVSQKETKRRSTQSSDPRPFETGLKLHLKLHSRCESDIRYRHEDFAEDEVSSASQEGHVQETHSLVHFCPKHEHPFVTDNFLPFVTKIFLKQRQFRSRLIIGYHMHIFHVKLIGIPHLDWSQAEIF